MHQLFHLNSQLYARLSGLDDRIGQLEEKDSTVQTLSASTMGSGATLDVMLNAEELSGYDGAGKSPDQEDSKAGKQGSAKRTVAKAFSGECSTTHGRTKYRKKLQLSIPSQSATSASGAGLPTPLASVSYLSFRSQL